MFIEALISIAPKTDTTECPSTDKRINKHKVQEEIKLIDVHRSQISSNL